MKLRIGKPVQEPIWRLVWKPAWNSIWDSTRPSIMLVVLDSVRYSIQDLDRDWISAPAWKEILKATQVGVDKGLEKR